MLRRVKPEGKTKHDRSTGPVAPIELIAGKEALQEGFARVAKAGGGAGADGMTIAAFAGNAGNNLRRLSRQVLEGGYKPKRTRRVELAKPDGSVRVLAIPCVRDRILQSAVAAELDRRLDHTMSKASFAYRKGLSVEHALSLVTLYGLRGYNHVLDGDIRRFFDEVPHARIGEMLRKHEVCPRTITLIGKWLWQHNKHGRGLPQGSPLSPVLSNLYLAPFDQRMDTKKTRLVRYADDFLILARSRETAEAALATARGVLKQLGLELNADKTRITHLDDGVRFLGAEIRGRR